MVNGEEQLFALYLENMRRSGHVLFWEYEPFTLKLGPSCRYTPDFVAVHLAVPRCGNGKERGVRVVVYEVKGSYIRDDAAVKLKVAAEKYWWLRFVLVRVGGRSSRKKRMEFEVVYPSHQLAEQLLVLGDGEQAVMFDEIVGWPEVVDGDGHNPLDGGTRSGPN